MDALGGVVIWSLIQLPEDDPGTDLGLGIGGRVKALRMSAVASPAQPSMLDVSGAGCASSLHKIPIPQSPLWHVMPRKFSMPRSVFDSKIESQLKF